MKKLAILFCSMIISGSLMAQKPTDGNPFSLEGNINYSSEFGLLFTAPSVRVRYFFKDNMAGRLQYGMNTSAETLSIGLGYEYHLGGTDRMSPYLGGLVGYDSYGDMDMTSFGVSIVGGMDYYIFENIYAGLELNLGFNSVSMDGDSDSNFGNSIGSAIRFGWRF